MEIVAIFAMIAAVGMTAAGLIGVVRSVRLRQEDGYDITGENLEDIHELQELAEQRASLIFQIRSVQFDQENSKLPEDKAEQLIRRLERRAVRISKRMDALVGDEDTRARAAEMLDEHINKTQNEVATQRWQWSEEALQRHGGYVSGTGGAHE